MLQRFRHSRIFMRPAHFLRTAARVSAVPWIFSRLSEPKVLASKTLRWEDRATHIAPTVFSLLGVLMFASASSAADVVVVCANNFRDALEPWCQLRRDEKLTLAFCQPCFTAEDTLTRIRETADEATRYVLLVGDAPECAPREVNAGNNRTAERHADQDARVPVFYLPSQVTARHGSTPTYPSDLPYGDLDGDGTHDTAVGRLPVVTPAQVAALVQRIIGYETSQDFGPWRRSFQLTAGVGGFGTFVDGAIESVTRTVLTSVLPADAKPQIAYASPGHPFCPPGASFCDAVMARYQNGARFWVYAGHGSIDQLNFLSRPSDDAGALTPATAARLTVDGKWQVDSLLDNQTVGRLVATPTRAPIAIMLACYAGAYDAPGDCLAERMLLTPGGPIAVIAASRLSMPYGNARFGLGLLESAYLRSDEDEAPERLGDAMRSAIEKLQSNDAGSTTQMMVDGLASLISPAGTELAEERGEHAGLYQLLGDPTLKLQAPLPLKMSVEAAPIGPQSLNATKVTSSKKTFVCVNCTSPIAGTLTVSVDRPLTAVSAPFGGSKTPPMDDPHGSTIGHVTVPIQRNIAGTATIAIPAQWSGPVVIRGFVQGQAGWASGAARTVVQSSSTANP